MSDSVDRVFVHALATVRRLPRTGSSRPPPSARLQLYGLYKQSMEGDVSAILPRPTLPPPSPDTASAPNPSSNSVHRYASRDLRTREAQAEIEKWDAWHACAGMSRTEAKRRYITTLIGTMKDYASGTAESRELVSELEFVWNQIRSQSGSDEGEEGESPTRRLERAGMKSMIPSTPGMVPRRTSPGDRGNSRQDMGSSSISSRVVTDKVSSPRQLSRSQSYMSSSNNNLAGKSTRHGLRILSPISQRSSDGIVENEELSDPIPANEEDDNEEEEEEEEGEEAYASASEDKLPQTSSSHLLSKPPPQYSSSRRNKTIATRTNPRNITTTEPDPSHTDPTEWRHQIESSLRNLTTELAALREQLSHNNLLTRSSFSRSLIPFSFLHPFSSHHSQIPTSGLTFRKRIFYRTAIHTRWLVWIVLRQLVIQSGLLAVVVVWGRWRGDKRVEEWVRGKVGEVWKRLMAVMGVGMVRWPRRWI